MEKDIVEGKIGAVGAYDVEFKAGKLHAELKAGALGVSVAVVIEIEADAVLDAIAKAVPGQIDDAVLGLVKAALKA